MTSLETFFSHFAFAQLVTGMLLLFPRAATNRAIGLFIALLGCGAAYVLTDVAGIQTHMSVLWWVAYIGGNALPGVFWLVSLCVFADRQVIKPWQWAVASLTLLIPLSSTLLQLAFNADLRQFPSLYGLVVYGAMALELVLICHALLVALRHWQDDLVQERRYMRAGVIGLVASYLFMIIVVEQVLGIEWHGLTTAKYVGLSVLLTGINFWFFALRENTLFDAAKGTSTTATRQAPAPEASAELQRVIAAMENDLLYRQEGLTISILSRTLGIHEYRLRQVINGEMAYRNFNDFLNHYRIKDVALRLREPQHSRTPILTLALDCGYRSLSSFNKAFKQTYGVTPSEYRSSAVQIGE
ncbi:AraC family transcriptional regulator [Aestuariibacter halophilus]|uniref:AraC family transcriptional regulator n=1 Tax=Fluctibacter halophilus TaxID=226011 RepID=A0ABS8G8X9_9ALTE|nr:AraC family transcriptional regulator [Aestuariibacter halophilus]MCC2616551.1 AraC family transcriptional regulator [Aestuariibacter halophilus]